MWIDSDIVFTPGQFQALLDYDKDIISGLYMMTGGKYFATVKNWDTEHFKKHGSFEFITEKHVQEMNGLTEVAYTGLGFMLVKRDVFESLEYPWFKPLDQKIGNAVDFTSEDVGFCLRVREKGYKVLIDPKIRVGHEKKVVM